LFAWISSNNYIIKNTNKNTTSTSTSTPTTRSSPTITFLLIHLSSHHQPITEIGTPETLTATTTKQQQQLQQQQQQFDFFLP
jgi:hypothetical protein